MFIHILLTHIHEDEMRKRKTFMGAISDKICREKTTQDIEDE